MVTNAFIDSLQLAHQHTMFACRISLPFSAPSSQVNRPLSQVSTYTYIGIICVYKKGCTERMDITRALSTYVQCIYLHTGLSYLFKGNASWKDSFYIHHILTLSLVKQILRESGRFSLHYDARNVDKLPIDGVREWNCGQGCSMMDAVYSLEVSAR